MRLHEFDPVPEGVIHVHAVVAVERLVINDAVICCGDQTGKRTDVFDEKRRVRLGCGRELGFDAEVDLEFSAFEPASTARCEVWRLRSLRNPEQTLVELGRLTFTSNRHGQLDVFDAGHLHRLIMARAPSPTPVL